MADQAERLDESLMLGGLGWREAASISNEAAGGEYAIATRCQLAADRADPADLAAALQRLGEGNNWPEQQEGESADDYNARMEEAMFGPQDADLDE